MLVKYRPLYRCGERVHSGKRKSMLTAMTYRSTHSPARVCVSGCALSTGLRVYFNYAHVRIGEGRNAGDTSSFFFTLIKMK